MGQKVNKPLHAPGLGGQRADNTAGATSVINTSLKVNAKQKDLAVLVKNVKTELLALFSDVFDSSGTL